MKTIRSWVGTIMVCAACMSCSNAGGPTTLTCDWLSENNCFQQLLESARSCTPRGTGAFDASETVCTYSDGATVSLTQGSTASSWNGASSRGFVATRDGIPCIEYTETSTSQWSYAVGDMAFTSEILSDGLEAWTCPDGSQFAITPEVQACANWASRSPGVSSSATSTSLGIHVQGLQPVLSILSCVTP